MSTPPFKHHHSHSAPPRTRLSQLLSLQPDLLQIILSKLPHSVLAALRQSSSTLLTHCSAVTRKLTFKSTTALSESLSHDLSMRFPQVRDVTINFNTEDDPLDVISTWTNSSTTFLPSLTSLSVHCQDYEKRAWASMHPMLHQLVSACTQLTQLQLGTGADGEEELTLLLTFPPHTLSQFVAGIRDLLSLRSHFQLLSAPTIYQHLVDLRMYNTSSFQAPLLFPNTSSCLPAVCQAVHLTFLEMYGFDLEGVSDTEMCQISCLTALKELELCDDCLLVEGFHNPGVWAVLTVLSGLCCLRIEKADNRSALPVVEAEEHDEDVHMSFTIPVSWRAFTQLQSLFLDAIQVQGVQLLSNLVALTTLHLGQVVDTSLTFLSHLNILKELEIEFHEAWKVPQEIAEDDLRYIAMIADIDTDIAAEQHQPALNLESFSSQHFEAFTPPAAANPEDAAENGDVVQFMDDLLHQPDSCLTAGSHPTTAQSASSSSAVNHHRHHQVESACALCHLSHPATCPPTLSATSVWLTLHLFSPLAHLTSLQDLQLLNAPATAAMLTTLATLPHLTALEISPGAEIDVAPLQQPAHLPFLKHLDIRHVGKANNTAEPSSPTDPPQQQSLSFKDAFLLSFTFPRLEKLFLPAACIKYPILHHFLTAHLKIDVDMVPSIMGNFRPSSSSKPPLNVTDDQLLHMAQHWPRLLDAADIACAALTVTGAERAFATVGSRLQAWKCHGPYAGDVCLLSISKYCPNLLRLRIYQDLGVEVGSLCTLLSTCTQLVHLDLDPVPWIDNKALLRIAVLCPQLQNLSLAGSIAIDNWGVASLGRLRCLRELRLKDCQLLTLQGVVCLLSMELPRLCRLQAEVWSLEGDAFDSDELYTALADLRNAGVRLPEYLIVRRLGGDSG